MDDLEKFKNSTKPLTLGYFTQFADALLTAHKAANAAHHKNADRITALEQKAAKLDSFERRLSRHADHLARLETRLKSLEHGGK